ncbi:hypothetical protein GCM10008905_25150 [Clostridium malenominatum]|uniref:DUF4363 family protein n=2 Tax=Clostridium malenominatum TaxID=1539 RepID=A0ABP3UDA5_9CLOT
MYGRRDMRIYIMFVWLIAFIFLWMAIYRVLPKNQIESKLQSIEENIKRDDWTEAKKQMEELKGIYINNRGVIQINNATEAFINFDYTFGQLDYAVQAESKNALEYVGALMYSLDYVVTAFSGP